MIETRKVVEIPAQLIATLHSETPRSKMQDVMGPGIREVKAAVNRSDNSDQVQGYFSASRAAGLAPDARRRRRPLRIPNPRT